MNFRLLSDMVKQLILSKKYAIKRRFLWIIKFCLDGLLALILMLIYKMPERSR